MQYTFVTSGKDREKSFIFSFTSRTISQRSRKRVESINRQQWTSHRDAACFKNQAQQAEVQFFSRLNLLAALAVLSKCKEIDKSTVLLSLHHAESCCLV
ncbi:hypothetical protein T12_14933 [Trichinella patagoniensis]|uniref:Uncharacterized protein n=1 Tax=Trichinella patagoniensis TaxID=990121 RepID=A0A0V1A0R0_9BILA|nr:hypothetical protein T12_6449 [Trichinella patagoniensis]KRY17994.1 hypothetical protein T12_14933 [Trichinella patagoniensis]